MEPLDRKILRGSASLGAGLWLLLLTLPLVASGAGAVSDRVFLLGPLVLVPLGLALLPDGTNYRTSRGLSASLARLQPIGAGTAAVTFYFEPGSNAAALAAVWTLVTVLALATAFFRVLERGLRRTWRTPDELAFDAATLPLALGGVFFTIARLGVRPFGLDPAASLSASLHLHFAGFVTVVIAAMAGRTEAGRVPAFRLVTGGVLAAPLLLLAGNASSPLLAVAGGLCELFALAVLLLSIGPALLAGLDARAARWILAPALGAGVLGALAGLGQSFATALARPFLSPVLQALLHGIPSGVVFGLGGLLAWTLEARLTEPAGGDDADRGDADEDNADGDGEEPIQEDGAIEDTAPKRAPATSALPVRAPEPARTPPPIREAPRTAAALPSVALEATRNPAATPERTGTVPAGSTPVSVAPWSPRPAAAPSAPPGSERTATARGATPRSGVPSTPSRPGGAPPDAAVPGAPPRAATPARAAAPPVPNPAPPKPSMGSASAPPAARSSPPREAPMAAPPTKPPVPTRPAETPLQRPANQSSTPPPPESEATSPGSTP